MSRRLATVTTLWVAAQRPAPCDDPCLLGDGVAPTTTMEVERRTALADTAPLDNC